MSKAGRRLNRRAWHAMRHRLARQGLGWLCAYCTRSLVCGTCIPAASPNEVATIDHIIPIRDGGPTAIENLALACVSCQNGKDNPRDQQPVAAQTGTSEVS